MSVAISREVSFDESTGEWCVVFGDEVKTVARSADKQVIEDLLDYLDAREETAS